MSMTWEEAIEFLGQYIDNDCYTDKCQDAHRMAIVALRGPTRETVERMRGEWINKHSVFDHKIFICSRCGKQISMQGENLSFCPACGAPMTDEAVDMMLERWKEAVDNG